MSRSGLKSSEWPGAVLRGDFGPIRIAGNTSIQDNLVIHPTPEGGMYIGSRCIIGHLAMIEEAVVEDGAIARRTPEAIRYGAEYYAVGTQDGGIAERFLGDGRQHIVYLWPPADR